jgi:hypothetical protein
VHAKVCVWCVFERMTTEKFVKSRTRIRCLCLAKMPEKEPMVQNINYFSNEEIKRCTELQLVHGNSYFA